MQRSDINPGSDRIIGDYETPSSCFDGKHSPIKLSSPLYRKSIDRFQLDSTRQTPDVDRSHWTVHTSGSPSPSREWVRNYSSPQIPSSTVDIEPYDLGSAYHRRTFDGRRDFGSCDIDRFRLGTCSIESNALSGTSNTDDGVTSSTPDDTHFVRSRSISFCNGWSPVDKDNLSSAADVPPSKPSISNYSILESILLDRDVPPFYSSLRSNAGDNCYERPRLRSMPLLSIIPPNCVLKVHSNPRSYVPYRLPSRGGGDLEKPLCLAFKRRKVSLENGCTAENELPPQRNDEKVDLSESNSLKSVRKGSVNRSILHSLLTFDSSYDDQNSNESERVKQMDITSESEMKNRNLDRTMYHVDSTDSLPTLERLALGDRSKLPSSRQQRVVIVKKMQLVVNRKVRRWLVDIAQMAARYRDLTDLPREDWIVLLRNAVSRLLLLHMAENNFQFAIAPVTTDDGDCKLSAVPAEVPTVGSVEEIQRFIAKCQTLKVDTKEYHCMRLITLFHSGCTNGIKQIARVEQMNSGACKILQDVVRLSRPHEKLRFGELLLHLHSLASVNSRMVQRLFCISPDGQNGNCIQIDESQWLMLDDL